MYVGRAWLYHINCALFVPRAHENKCNLHGACTVQMYNVRITYTHTHTLHNILYAFLFIKCLNLVDDGDRGFLLPYMMRMASNLLGSYAAKQLQNVSKLSAHKTISCDHYSNAFFPPMYVSFFSGSVSFFSSFHRNVEIDCVKYLVSATMKTDR